jgi:hypothetical protein
MRARTGREHDGSISENDRADAQAHLGAGCLKQNGWSAYRISAGGLRLMRKLQPTGSIASHGPNFDCSGSKVVKQLTRIGYDGTHHARPTRPSWLIAYRDGIACPADRHSDSKAA